MDENWGGSPKSKVSFLASRNKPTLVPAQSFLLCSILMIRVGHAGGAAALLVPGASLVPYGRFICFPQLQLVCVVNAALSGGRAVVTNYSPAF